MCLIINTNGKTKKFVENLKLGKITWIYNLKKFTLKTVINDVHSYKKCITIAKNYNM